jgi:hypothetical protein
MGINELWNKLWNNYYGDIACITIYHSVQYCVAGRNRGKWRERRGEERRELTKYEVRSKYSTVEMRWIPSGQPTHASDDEFEVWLIVIELRRSAGESVIFSWIVLICWGEVTGRCRGKGW